MAGLVGPIILAIEDRIHGAILLAGGPWGFDDPLPPEIDPFNYADKFHAPTLILNGRHDERFDALTCQIPLYEMLATEEKMYRVASSGHVMPKQFTTTEYVAWLDRLYGSPLNPREEAPWKPEWLTSFGAACSKVSIGSVTLDHGGLESGSAVS